MLVVFHRTMRDEVFGSYLQAILPFFCPSLLVRKGESFRKTLHTLDFGDAIHLVTDIFA
jgi:hypothetical protein